MYKLVRLSGTQTAHLYGLAKVHNHGTPLRPVLSLPGSYSEKLTKELASLFDDTSKAETEMIAKLIMSFFRPLLLIRVNC